MKRSVCILSWLMWLFSVIMATPYVQLTNLPTVYIETESGLTPKDKKHQLECMITIVADSGRIVLHEKGTVRLRGNSTMKMPKKPYRIKFDKKQQVLDATAKAKKWTLLANYGDKTLMRNAVAFYVARQLEMEYVPYLRPVDVYMNGEFQGNYQLCDQIDVRKGRVDIDEMTSDDNSGERLTGGYLIEVDAYAVREPRNGWFYSNHGTPVTFKSPDADNITDAQRLYIQQQFNAMEEHWRTRLDMESFERQFIAEELLGNMDAYWSVYMYKRRNDERLYMGPIWDFDLAMDNDRRIYSVNWENGWSFEHGGSTAGHMRKLVHEIVHDKAVNRRLCTRWADARTTERINADSICAFIDAYAAQIDDSQQRNFERWHILDKTVFYNPVCYYTYEGEVEALKTYFRERIKWMDDRLKYTAPEDDPSYRADHFSLDPDQVRFFYTVTGEICIASYNSLPPGIYLTREGMQTVKLVIR